MAEGLTVLPEVTRAALAGLLDAARTPGRQYVVVTRDGPIYTHAGGAADLETRRPMQDATTMMAYSMSKTITAVAALQLVDRGRLTLDGPVADHLPESPYGGDVTVRMLVTHTGGIPNPIPLKWVHPATADGFDEDAAFAAVLRAYPRPARPAGSAFGYSNLGYWMLGKIIERASGVRFTRYVETEILEPLGIASRDAGYAIVDPEMHAAGYLEKYSAFNALKRWLLDPALIGTYQGPWLTIRPHYPNGPAFGGLVGTAAAFGGFLRDQLQPHSALVSDPARALLYTAQTTKNGAPIPMTLGWHVQGTANAPLYYKEGGGGGFHCMMRLHPAHGFGTVLMTNATGLNVRRLLDRLDAVVKPALPAS